MSRYLVTGAAGFVGGAVTKALSGRGDDVVAFDRAEASGDNVATVVGDITDQAALRDAMQTERPDAVVHCAAVVGVPASVQAPVDTIRVNVEGSLLLFEAMAEAGVKRAIHISSEEVYGPFQAEVADENHPCNPMMAYGISKLAVEQLGRSYGASRGLEVINLRTSWVYGPGLPRPRIPKNLVGAAVTGERLHLETGGETRIDHTYIDDAVAGILAALHKPVHDFDVYNIGSGTAPSLGEIVAIIRELVPGADIAVGPGEYRHGDGTPLVRKGAMGIARARAELGYAPAYDIRAGLAAYVAALRSAD